MGKLVDRDYLWLREPLQTPPNRRRWAPFALIPIVALLAWFGTAPDRSSDTSATRTTPPIRPRLVVPSILPGGFATETALFQPTGADHPPRFTLAPAQFLTDDTNRSVVDWQRVAIHQGDTLSLAFARHGLSYTDSLRIAHLPEIGHYFTRGLKAGDVLRVRADQAGRIQRLTYEIDPLHHLTVQREGDRLSGALAELQATHRRTYTSGVITRNFYRDAQRAGLGEQQMSELRRIFAWNIDFERDIQPGDRFMVIYDELYHDNKKLGNGPILAATLMNKDRPIQAIRYTDRNGHSDYYRPNGRPMRQAFVRAPVNYTHISSSFDLNRKHPILHRLRRHEGTDYAAPIGTPIHATGSGRIVFQGRRGGYGNMVTIRHDADITLRFAHMSRFARGLHVGSSVEQGDLIGYVGMTGLATGPHVHYEFRIDDQPRNPQTVTLPGTPPLTGSALAAFRHKKAGLISRLAEMTERHPPIAVASSADR